MGTNTAVHRMPSNGSSPKGRLEGYCGRRKDPEPLGSKEAMHGKPCSTTTTTTTTNIARKTNKLWPDIKQMVLKGKWDAIALVETNWREGQQGKHLEGYQRFRKDCEVTGKAGGGIAVFVKKELNAYVWDNGGDNEKTDIDRENIWVVVKGEQDVAIGVVYLAAGGTERNTNWNEKLLEKIQHEIEVIRNQGLEIIIVGDFNGHIGEKEGGRVRGWNVQGMSNVKAWKEWGVEMVNRSRKCKGKWTRMRGNQKSEIDFVLVNKGKLDCIDSMKIDEKGGRLAQGSDHNWIEVQFTLTGKLKTMRADTERWDIGKRTNWEQFRKCLGGKLRKWRQEYENVRRTDGGDVKVVYQELIKCIIEAAKETIGIREIGRKGKDKGKKFSIKKCVKKRNKAGRNWRKLVRGGEANDEEMDEAWRHFLGLEKKANRIRTKGMVKIRNMWRIKSLGKNKGECKSIWKYLRTHREMWQLARLQNKESNIVTEPEEIKKLVGEYIRKLGDEDRSEISEKRVDINNNIDEGEGYIAREEGGDMDFHEFTRGQYSKAIKELKS